MAMEKGIKEEDEEVKTRSNLDEVLTFLKQCLMRRLRLVWLNERGGVGGIEVHSW